MATLHFTFKILKQSHENYKVILVNWNNVQMNISFILMVIVCVCVCMRVSVVMQVCDIDTSVDRCVYI